MRGNEFFAVRKLGAIGTSLSAVASFFKRSWSEVHPSFTELDKCFIVNWTAFFLRGVGRLSEASQPMVLGIEASIKEGDWNGAAIDAGSLSELYLTLGDVSAAVRAAEGGVELADRSDDANRRMFRRTTLAAVLHRAARPERSLAAFHEAEAMQAEDQPEYPLLYSLRGFQYCNLLLEEVWRVIGPLSIFEPKAGEPQIEAALSRCREVRRRAETTLEWVRGKLGILDEALDHLTLGRTYLLEGQVLSVAGREPEDDVLTQAETHLTEAVSLLRQAGQQQELPRGLLARAALHRVKFQMTNDASQIANAERDLDEAEQIAGRGGMLIWQIEAALERCRLALACGNRDGARRKLDEAKALVKKTEKLYEPHQPDWDEWQPPEYVGVFREGEIVGYHRRNADIDALENELK